MCEWINCTDINRINVEQSFGYEQAANADREYPPAFITDFYDHEDNTIKKEGGRNGRHVYKDYRRTSI